MRSGSYYGESRHEYMRRAPEFAEYVYRLIAGSVPPGCTTAVELGAGMGRFSTPLVERFREVVLVEPNEAHAASLDDAFAENSNVKVVRDSAESFLAGWVPERPVTVFCFHLMHHLDGTQRRAVYDFVRRTGSRAVLVEPNPFNPLILLQILLHPHMTFSEEIEYLRLTPARYRTELAASGLDLSRSWRLCLLPPPLTSLLLRIAGARTAARLELLGRLFPVLPSYQTIVFEGPA